MSMVKVTFTLDAGTVTMLRQAAARLNRPQSRVIRDAVAEYADRIGRLSQAEQTRMLAALDAIVSRRPTRPVTEVDAELRAIRLSRRRGGRRRRRS